MPTIVMARIRRYCLRDVDVEQVGPGQVELRNTDHDDDPSVAACAGVAAATSRCIGAGRRGAIARIASSGTASRGSEIRIG